MWIGDITALGLYKFSIFYPMALLAPEADLHVAVDKHRRLGAESKRVEFREIDLFIDVG